VETRGRENLHYVRLKPLHKHHFGNLSREITLNRSNIRLLCFVARKNSQIKFSPTCCIAKSFDRTIASITLRACAPMIDGGVLPVAALENGGTCHSANANRARVSPQHEFIARFAVFPRFFWRGLALTGLLARRCEPYFKRKIFPASTPVQFSHKHPRGDDGMCRYCHTSVENSPKPVSLFFFPPKREEWPLGFVQ